MERNRGSLGREGGRQGGADAPSGSGDEDDSVGEPEITLRISLVAVCCSSASVSARLRACSSVNSRTFSIAMTAWSANVFNSAIWRSVNGRTSRRRMVSVPIASPSRSIGTDTRVRYPASRAVARRWAKSSPSGPSMSRMCTG